MKILHVIPSLANVYGGPSQACVEMAQAMQRRGHEVVVATTDNAMTDEDYARIDAIAASGVETRVFRHKNLGRWVLSLDMLRGLRAEVRTCDVVHIHALFHFHIWAAAVACREASVPYLVRPCGALAPVITRRSRLVKQIVGVLFHNAALRDAALIHCTTEQERLEVSNLLGSVATAVVPLGLDLEAYRSNIPRERPAAIADRIGNRPYVLFFGRLNFKKGLEVLADAFAQIAKRFPEHRLVYVGPADRGMRELVEHHARTAGIAERCVFTGALSGAAKRAALAHAEVFALPSYNENFGIAVIEALACGTPVALSTEVGVWREIVKADLGKVAKADADEFASVLLACLEDADWRASVRDRAQDFIARTYDWAAISETLEGIYEQVAHGEGIRTQMQEALAS